MQAIFQNHDINQQDKYGYTALIVASKLGQKEIAQMLLQNKNIQIYQKDKIGKTALIWASENGHKEVVQILEAKEILF